MATSTYMTFLMHKKETAWEKLLDITEFPDLGGDPELLETTTLSDKMQTYVNGVQSNDGMTFNANYDHTEYKALKALEGVRTRNTQYGSVALRLQVLRLLRVLRVSSSLQANCPSTLLVAA